MGKIIGKLSEIDPNNIVEIAPAARSVGPEPELEESEEAPSSFGEKVEALAMGLGQGATFGFGDEALAALEALKQSTVGDKKMQDILSTYREAQKRNEAAYEDMAKKHGALTLAGELGGGFLLPVPGATARAASKGIGLEKALATLLGSSKGPATKLAEHMGTGAVLGAVGGLGSSKGTVEGTLGLGEDKQGVLGDMGTGAGLGLGVGALARGFEKVLGGVEEAISRDISAKRAKATYELQSGTREGYDGPVNISDAPNVTADIDSVSPSGGEKILNRVSDVAKNLREEAFGIRQQQKDRLTAEFNAVRDVDVYNVNEPENVTNYINEPFFGYKRALSPDLQDAISEGRPLNQNHLSELYDYIKNKKLQFNPIKKQGDTFSIISPQKFKFFIDKNLNTILESAAIPKDRLKFLKTVDSDIFNKIRNQSATVSDIQNYRKALLSRGSKIADEMNLPTFERDYIFGNGDFQRVEDDVTSGGLADYLEDVISKFIPSIQENRKLIKASSAPLEMLLSGSDDPVLTKVRIYDYFDPEIQNKVQKELEKIIKKIGGSNQQAHDYEKLFNQFRMQMRERNRMVYADSPAEYSKAVERLKKLEKDVDLSSMDFSALVAEKGIDSIIDDSISSVKNAYTNVKEMPLSTGAKVMGKAKKTMTQAVEEVPSVIKTPIGLMAKGPFSFAKANVEDLKEAANLLSTNKTPWVANFGRAMREGMETSHTGKAVFLNSAYQNPSLRKILGLTVGKQEEPEKEEEEE